METQIFPNGGNPAVFQIRNSGLGGCEIKVLCLKHIYIALLCIIVVVVH